MIFGSRRITSGVLCSLAGCLLIIGSAKGQAGQTSQAQRQPMAEEVFKKVDILKGIPVDEFMDTMGMFAAALSLNCIDCHVPESVGGWERSEEHTSELQSLRHLVCRLLLEKKKKSIHQVAYELLHAHGMTTVFGNPGSNELPFLNDFQREFRYILVLHEGDALAITDC